MKQGAAMRAETSERARDWSVVRRYGVAMLASAVALLVTAVLRPWLGQTIYLFVYPAVMMSAWYGGVGPGVLTALSGAVMAAVLFLKPLGSVRIDDPSALATAGMLVGTAWLVGTLSDGIERARREVESRAQDAEALASSLEEQATELEAQVEENQELVERLEGVNESLARAAEQALGASRAKSAFLATMSHELRTPLNAIDGYAALIEMGIYGPTSPGQMEALARIRASHSALLTLVDQVIDQARMEAGKLPLEVAPVPIADPILATRNVVEPLARAKHMELCCEPVDETLAAMADASRVTQILVNLATNAVKFTDPGGRVTIAWEADDREVRVVVHDEGWGIPPDKLDSIFDPFFQVDQSTTRREGGAGLGLTISRDLARAMGGRITVESEVGVGSTFTLTLPRYSPVGVG